jgi:hypothetical protein
LKLTILTNSIPAHEENFRVESSDDTNLGTPH